MKDDFVLPALGCHSECGYSAILVTFLKVHTALQLAALR